ncbi:MAG TPA: DNA replication and repair protein RecF [Gemmatimonadaceae bacterium]|nr:DNA replication and repair protein RecF [Gemmatimonadaceae bacterium]
MATGSRAGIASLSLQNFRNFERLGLDIPREGLVIVGDNGQGKTNLLEAVYYLSLFRSTRGARDTDVTRFGAAGFFVEASVCTPEPHEVSVGFERNGRRKRVRVDGVVIERLSAALGTLPAVMFAPGDVEIVAGGASARRRFLDIMLALSSRGYLRSLQQYRAALERRNAALRDAARRGTGAPLDAIAVWEPALAEHGARIARARRMWVGQVTERFAERCVAIGERGRAEIRYAANVEVNAESLEGAIAEALANRRALDARLGVTHAGPHRDDLSLTLDGRDLRTFGSAGQQRTAAIALRTLEAETLRDAREAAPVFLLDDPFAELDDRRASRVLGLLGDIGIGQAILAVPRDAEIPGELTRLPRCRVAAGVVQS